jgi:hypothetical protein
MHFFSYNNATIMTLHHIINVALSVLEVMCECPGFINAILVKHKMYHINKKQSSYFKDIVMHSLKLYQTP